MPSGDSPDFDAGSWDRGRRIRVNLIDLTLQNNQIWIEYDDIEQGITDDLITAGIPSERVVLAFLRESQTALSAWRRGN